MMANYILYILLAHHTTSTNVEIWPQIVRKKRLLHTLEKFYRLFVVLEILEKGLTRIQNFKSLHFRGV
jgi:hypothetical protein